MVKIIVYGTLRKGHGNHWYFLDNDESTLIGEALMPSKGKGWYLAPMTKVVSPGSCWGEVYEVSDRIKAKIDDFEKSFGYTVARNVFVTKENKSVTCEYYTLSRPESYGAI